MTSEELKAIYANAPVGKTPFEVITLTAPWYSQTYHLTNLDATEGEDIEVVFETGQTVTVSYAPMDVGQTSSNADLNYERSIVIQYVNDIIATEASNFNPDIHNPRDQKIEARGYIYYRDGTISAIQGSPVTTTVREMTRESKNGATQVRTSSKPANQTATGEVITISRFPMLRGFL